MNADIVIAGLPENGEALPDELIERIHPKLIVIADSEFPPTRRANRALQNRLRRSGIPVFFTRIGGAIKLTMHDGEWRISTAH